MLFWPKFPTIRHETARISLLNKPLRVVQTTQNYEFFDEKRLNKETNVPVAEQLFKGMNHYFALHRLSIEIHVPSRCSILKTSSVCLYKFGIKFFFKMFSTTYQKFTQCFRATLYRYLLVSENLVKTYTARFRTS